MKIEEILKQKYVYYPETGTLLSKTWNKVVNKTDRSGYIQINIRIDGKRKYLAGHRVAWLLNYGWWPENQIDHINGNKTDNRLINLRIATKHQNMANQKCHRDGKLIGACFDKNMKKWRSRIKINNKTVLLGYYETELEAHNVYISYKLIHGL